MLTSIYQTYFVFVPNENNQVYFLIIFSATIGSCSEEKYSRQLLPNCPHKIETFCTLLVFYLNSVSASSSQTRRVHKIKEYRETQHRIKLSEYLLVVESVFVSILKPNITGPENNQLQWLKCCTDHVRQQCSSAQCNP